MFDTIAYFKNKSTLLLGFDSIFRFSQKTGFSESKYLKIVHKNMEVSNAFLENKASITLTSSLGIEEYESYKTLL